MPAPRTPKQNHLLAALPSAACERLLPQREPVSLKLGSALCASGSAQGYVYFPTDSIASLLYVMEGGASVEIEVVGIPSLDLLPEDELTMIQELIANMPGVRREGVTGVVGRLQEAESIRYSPVAAGSPCSTSRSWRYGCASATP